MKAGDLAVWSDPGGAMHEVEIVRAGPRRHHVRYATLRGKQFHRSQSISVDVKQISTRPEDFERCRTQQRLRSLRARLAQISAATEVQPWQLARLDLAWLGEVEQWVQGYPRCPGPEAP